MILLEGISLFRSSNVLLSGMQCMLRGTSKAVEERFSDTV